MSTVSEPAAAHGTVPAARTPPVDLPRVPLWCDPEDLVELLDLRPGHRVLEINPQDSAGTMAFGGLVGPMGTVSSLCATEVGSAPVVPYDRLVAWSAPPQIPGHWIRHVAPGGIAVIPVPLAPLAAAEAVAQIRLNHDGGPEVVELIPNALLGRRPLRELPGRFVDCATRDSAGRWSWISAEWLHGRNNGVAVDLLDLLRAGRRRRPSPLPAHAGADLVGYLLGRRPDGMLTAGLGDLPPGVGCALPGSAAVLSGDELVLGGTSEALAGLMDWVTEWRAAGSPGLSAFRPYLERRHSSAWEIAFHQDVGEPDEQAD